MPLSIFIYGNTNNCPYLLAEGFRALGHNVRLVINKKELLQRPESLNPDWSTGYPEWISDYSHLTELDIACESYGVEEMMFNLTSQADFAVLNDIGPALASYLRCPYASVLTGSDLTYYADFKSVELRTATWDSAFRRTSFARRLVKKLNDQVVRQRDGILMSSVVSYGARGLIPEGDALLDAIGVLDAQRTMIYFSDTSRVAMHPIPNNRNMKIFCGSRVVINQNTANTYSSIDFKGTDILIKGFAEYCCQGGGGMLYLPKKGSSLEDAIRMIRELGIESRVILYDTMSLKQFEQELISSDLVCDQFGSSFPGMVTTHAYALSRPVMANFRREVMPFDLPGLHVVTPADVCDALIFADRNRSELTTLGKESRLFAERHLSPKTMAENLLKRTGLA
jgi:glycosyltransferase involved in cell wall biosynthesis